MIRKHFRFKRLVLGLALGLVFAVVAVPTASAKPVSSAVLNGPLDAWAVNAVYQSTHPSNLGPLDAWAVNAVDKSTHPVATKAVDLGPLDPWAYAVIHRSSPTVVTARSDNGFNYSDAGIGASFVFGAALVLVTALALGRRYRSRFDRSGLATL